jgi:taurine dioxygenase
MSYLLYRVFRNGRCPAQGAFTAAHYARNCPQKFTHHGLRRGSIIAKQAARAASAFHRGAAPSARAKAAERQPVQHKRFQIRSLCEAFGAELRGVDLSGSVDEELYAAIRAAFVDYQLLLFRDQDLPPASHVALGRSFGEVQIHVMSQYHADGFPELYFLSNLDESGDPSGKHPDKGTLAWHSDGSWRRVTGQATMLYAVQVPRDGGETHFCDMYGAYEALDEAMKARLEGVRAVHNLDFSRTRRHGEDPMTEAQRREVPPVDHPVVRTHPETGRKCIFLGDHAETIAGLDYQEGRRLVEEVNALAIRPELIYRHVWRPRDLVIWDNRCLMHRATPYDTVRERRVMRRCTILGEVPH